MDSRANQNLLRLVYVGLFMVSGFAGLIYESIWSHYLKLFLGHAAYAQVVVLCMFMGGMALGAWGTSRFSERIRNPLVAYALIEGLIGIAAIFFHPIFVGVTGHALDVVFLRLGSPLAVELYRFSLAGALILPQSVLLGATFPLMSAGLIRRFPEAPGRLLATLYFANSLGGAAGVLASGFVLIGKVGLPGTLMFAGILNCVLALAVWGLARERKTGPLAAPTDGRGNRRLLGLFMLCAAVTGIASFLYEIAWIRMLSLVLGSSTHAFELMLSAFILGLAIGGLWIRRRIDGLASPARTLGVIQVAMGGLALLSLVGYAATFDLMGGALRTLARTETGYTLFNLFSHGLCLIVMLPATVCAGMTLPLITYHLLRHGGGEQAIGRVYAANTVGAILGVLLGAGLLMPWLGVKQLVVAGAALDIGLGLALLWSVTGAAGARRVPATAGLACLIALAVAVVADLDTKRMASGVFRYGRSRLGQSSEVVFHRDGRTASVDVVVSPARMIVSTNGKPDAAVSLVPGQVSDDEPTMTLAAAIPWSLHSTARRAAVIGLGCGMTTHTLLTIPDLESVETIEIEPAMVAAARYFGEHVQRAFTDPRSRIHIADAKTFFTAQRKRYDLIISEPSNPWVSGVAGLFSKEFYKLVSRHLADGGLFAQWIHVYEIDPPLVASVMNAMTQVFADYVLFGTSHGDLLIVACADGPVGELTPAVFEPPALRERLERIGIRSMPDLRLTRIGSQAIMAPLIRSFTTAANSDYYPLLDLGAARARFLGRDAFALFGVAPTAWLLEGRRPDGRTPISPDHPLGRRYAAHAGATDQGSPVTQDRLAEAAWLER